MAIFPCIDVGCGSKYCLFVYIPTTSTKAERSLAYVGHYPVCTSVVVVIVGTKIARSRILGICACCKYNQLVCTCFELLKKAY